MKIASLCLIGLIALSACTPTVPASNAGVGFTDAEDWELERARREAALAGSGSTAFQPPQTNQTQAIDASDLAGAGIGQPEDVGAPMTAMGDQATQTPQRVPGVEATPANANNGSGISDEQDFSAVTDRESIESDAARRAAQAAAREQVAPTALPTRPSDTGPNIVEYALSAPNVKGQEWYSRSIFSTQGRFRRNCAGYNSPDAAQRDFLARGGPDRDPHGIDPDGDGFACGWDPAPFKLAAQG